MNGAAVILLVALLPASTARERRLHEEFDDLTARTAALVDVVNQLETNLRDQGQVLHPNIASTRNSLVAAMDRASDALRRHDWPELRRSLDRARGWIERLRRQL